MVRSLISTISKDLKILFRSKVSATAIFLAPLIIIIFLGYAFNSSGTSGIAVSTFSEDYTNQTESIITVFQQEGFEVSKVNSELDCTNNVKLGSSQICIVFPKNLSETGSSEEIIFYVDQSRMNIAYSLIEDTKSTIAVTTSGISLDLAQELIDTLESAKTSVQNQKDSITESKSSIGTIGNKASSTVYSSEIETVISNLESAKSKTNESTLLSKINTAITDLEEIYSDAEETSSRLEEIKSESESINSKLAAIESEIEEIISAIDKKNIHEAEKIISPVKTKVEPINDKSTNREFLLPTMLAVIALFGGVMISSTFVLKERKTKAYFRNFMTPTWDLTFIFANYITCMIILLIQFIFVFAGLQWISGIDIVPHLLDLSIVLFASSTVFIFLGTAIGYLFNSEETTIFSAVIVSAILIFFSNTILPIETISSSLQKLTFFNPLVMTDLALKKILFFEMKFYAVTEELLFLGIIFVGALIISYFGRKITKRTY